jgi:predicted ATPase
MGMNKIEIKGYKSIKDQIIEINSINILIGANGSGKSNFLSFFEFLFNLYEQKLRQYVKQNGEMDSFIHKGADPTTVIYSKLHFGPNQYSFQLDKGEEHFVFINEGLWYDRNPYYANPFEISNFGNEAALKYNSSPRAKYTTDFLSSFKKYHFHDTGKNSPFNSPSNIENDSYVLYSDGSNIASILYRIKEKKTKLYLRIINNIQNIAPFFNDFYLHPDENNSIKLKWTDKYSEHIYGVNNFSDGTIRFIALTVLFMQPILPKIIILDEPELGLHPVAVTNLADMILSVREECQVIIATQSIDLLNNFKPEDIITVDNIDGESQFNRLDSQQYSNWINEYSVGTLWKNLIINNGQPQ